MIDNENWTFHPDLNPKSIEISKIHSTINVDERLYQSQEDMKINGRSSSKENPSTLYLSEQLKLYQDSLRTNKFELSSEKSNKKSSAKAIRGCSKTRWKIMH